MTELVKSRRSAINFIDDFLSVLSGIEKLEMKDLGDYKLVSDTLATWKANAVRGLAEAVHPKESRRLESVRLVPRFFLHAFSPDIFRDIRDQIAIYREFLERLRNDLQVHPQEILFPAEASGAVPPSDLTAAEVDPRSVFIVHGHDELNLLRLKQLFSERWGLTAVVLKERPGRGRAVIEKFEQEAKSAAFAFALFTPDDFVVTGKAEYAQARPNTIFELGWFYGRLGRHRVAILFKRGTSIHSDLDGISRIEFDENIEEKILEIEKELIEAKILTRGKGSEVSLPVPEAPPLK